MRIVTLLLKVMAKSVSPYASMESSLFLCGLLLKSVMGQLQVGCTNELESLMHLDTLPSSHLIIMELGRFFVRTNLRNRTEESPTTRSPLLSAVRRVF